MEQAVIKVEGLTKQYGKDVVVDHVDFRIEKGKIYGLVGPNGAGKSTVMKMLGGLTFPTDGEIYFYGEASQQALNSGRARMSFMIEEPKLNPDWSGRDNLKREQILRGVTDDAYVDELLRLVDLDQVSSKKKVKSYSLGMKQRLGIVMALLSKPDVLILDEPVNGLDPRGVYEIRMLLQYINKEFGTTIILSSHILSELEYLCTDLIFLLQGKVIKTVAMTEMEDSLENFYLNHVDCREEKKMEVLSTFAEI